MTKTNRAVRVNGASEVVWPQQEIEFEDGDILETVHGGVGMSGADECMLVISCVTGGYVSFDRSDLPAMLPLSRTERIDLALQSRDGRGFWMSWGVGEREKVRTHIGQA